MTNDRIFSMTIDLNDVGVLVSMSPFLTHEELGFIQTDKNDRIIDKIKSIKMEELESLVSALGMGKRVRNDGSVGGIDGVLYEVFVAIRSDIHNLNDFSNILNLIRIFNSILKFFNSPVPPTIPARFSSSPLHPYINILIDQFILVARVNQFVVPNKKRILSTI